MFAPDSPGFGNSDPLPGESTLDIADFARVIQGFCEGLNLAPCFVFGHHTGASVAVQLEHDFPGTARAIALSGPPLLTDDQKESLPGSVPALPPETDGTHLQAMWHRLRDKDPDAPLALTQRELLSAFACGDAYPASYEAVARQDFAAMLPAIGCPVRVFAGDLDPLYGAVEPTVQRLEKGDQVALPGGERTYVCERQAAIIAGVLHDFFGAEAG